MCLCDKLIALFKAGYRLSYWTMNKQLFVTNMQSQKYNSLKLHSHLLRINENKCMSKNKIKSY